VRRKQRRYGRLHAGHVEAAVTHGAGIGGALARSGKCGQNSAGSMRYHAASSRNTPGLSETDWVGTVALDRAQFGAQCCFFNYSNFA
jgi:hypothetical protein